MIRENKEWVDELPARTSSMHDAPKIHIEQVKGSQPEVNHAMQKRRAAEAAFASAYDRLVEALQRQQRHVGATPQPDGKDSDFGIFIRLMRRWPDIITDTTFPIHE
jgi:hypothetical protein